MQKSLKPLTRSLLIAGLIILVFVISEVIYEIRNPYYATQYTNNLSRVFIEKNELKPAIFFLDLTSTVHTYITGTRFPGKIRKIFIPKNLKDIDETTKKELLDLAKDRIYDIKKDNNIQRLANFYYHLGLILYEKGYKESAGSFFMTAINLNPEMSFLFAELADSYFDSGQKADGLSILSYCLDFPPAKEHCQTFLKEYFENGTTYKVGYYSDTIDEFHSKK